MHALHLQLFVPVEDVDPSEELLLCLFLEAGNRLKNNDKPSWYDLADSWTPMTTIVEMNAFRTTF